MLIILSVAESNSDFWDTSNAREGMSCFVRSLCILDIESVTFMLVKQGKTVIRKFDTDFESVFRNKYQINKFFENIQVSGESTDSYVSDINNFYKSEIYICDPNLILPNTNLKLHTDQNANADVINKCKVFDSVYELSQHIEDPDRVDQFVQKNKSKALCIMTELIRDRVSAICDSPNAIRCWTVLYNDLNLCPMSMRKIFRNRVYHGDAGSYNEFDWLSDLDNIKPIIRRFMKQYAESNKSEDCLIYDGPKDVLLFDQIL